MNSKKLHILGEMPVPQAILKLAVPTMLGMIVLIFYNMTDTFFVGKLNDPNQMAAIAVTMPLFMMLLAFSAIFGHGGASYLSRLLGQKDYETAKQTVATAWFSCALVGILVTIFGLFWLSPILTASGASAQTAPFAASYLRIILAGSVVIMLNFTAGQLLRAEGAAKEAMIGMALGTVINIVLDPLFILTFDQGVAGAAIATLIGNAAGLLYYISYYIRRKSLVPLSFRHIPRRWNVYAEMIKIGFPASISQIMMGVANAFANSIAVNYGDIVVAAIGIDMRLFSMPITLTIGLASGAQPLIGYSYGANNIPRLKASINIAGMIATGIMLVCTAVFALFPAPFIKMFINDAAIVTSGTTILRAFIIGLPFVGVQLVLMNALQAMGKGVPALIVSLSRQGIVFIPAILILNRLFGFSGFIYAMGTADILSALLAITLFLRIVKQLQADNPVPLSQKVSVYSG